MAVNRDVARQSHDVPLDRMQVATTQLVPGALSIALSLRELVRQGYLLSAQILLRPLVERVGILSLLIDCPEKLDAWENGWPAKDRPRLHELLRHMKGGSQLQDADDARLIAKRYHALVHGEPWTAGEVLVRFPDGSVGLTPGKDLHSPDRADAICFEAAMYLIVLMARAVQVFGGADTLP